MDRRTFLMATTTCLSLPASAQAYSFVQFTPAKWEELLQSGQTVILNFRANWSFTCNLKLEIIAHLIVQNPDYRTLTFIDINWDTYGQSQFAARLKVERHSTLIVMQAGREVTRIVNEPHERKIRAFLDSALTV